MKHENTCFITGIDHEHHSICLCVNGMQVTAVCSTKSNEQAYQAIQAILIDSILKTSRIES